MFWGFFLTSCKKLMGLMRFWNGIFVDEQLPKVAFFACFTCSWPARRELLRWDVQAGSLVRVSVHWTGLLEGSYHRRRARHYTRIHHDLWNLLQGKYPESKVMQSVRPCVRERMQNVDWLMGISIVLWYLEICFVSTGTLVIGLGWITAYSQRG